MDRYSTNVEAAAVLAAEDFYGDDDRPTAAELAEDARWDQRDSLGDWRTCDAGGWRAIRPDVPCTPEDFAPRDERGNIIQPTDDLPF